MESFNPNVLLTLRGHKYWLSFSRRLGKNGMESSILCRSPEIQFRKGAFCIYFWNLIKKTSRFCQKCKKHRLIHSLIYDVLILAAIPFICSKVELYSRLSGKYSKLTKVPHYFKMIWKFTIDSRIGNKQFERNLKEFEMTS